MITLILDLKEDEMHAAHTEWGQQIRAAEALMEEAGLSASVDYKSSWKLLVRARLGHRLDDLMIKRNIFIHDNDRYPIGSSRYWSYPVIRVTMSDAEATLFKLFYSDNYEIEVLKDGEGAA